MPLPAPNPAMNHFIANYTPMNCMEETWPFFLDVVGTWVGSGGQDFISLPQQNAPKMFIVQVNRYEEELQFEAIGGSILNRGYLDAVQVNPTGQSDQVLQGLLYLQKVMDLDLMQGIHEENGAILHKTCTEVNSNITDPWQVLRAGQIPHGSQPMGFGNMTMVDTPHKDYFVQMLLRVRETYEFSVQPFVPGCGPQAEQQRQLAATDSEQHRPARKHAVLHRQRQAHGRHGPVPPHRLPRADRYSDRRGEGPERDQVHAAEHDVAELDPSGGSGRHVGAGDSGRRSAEHRLREPQRHGREQVLQELGLAPHRAEA
mmetsp:Transcript_59451/g.156489  ORF Transcript_59451/g.156489 Transcript_59451/m.156489 type:complete len:315 (+) Transcript_59451:364-1308(+)